MCRIFRFKVSESKTAIATGSSINEALTKVKNVYPNAELIKELEY